MKVIYLLLHFPRLTETFIADEIWALASHDVEVRIVSLLRPAGGLVQARSLELLGRVSYTPGVFTLATWRAQLHFLLTSSRLYLSLLATLLREPYVTQPVRSAAKRLVVFLRATTAAYTLRNSDIDLLHSHFAWLPGAAAWICARLLRKPFTVTVHAYDIYSHRNDLLRLVSHEADHVVAVSDFNRSRVHALAGCPLDRLSVIHCGIDLSDSPAASSEWPALGAKAPIRILSVGSLVAKKGHRTLVLACDLLRQRDLNFICTIIGGGTDELSLRKHIQSLGLQERVVLRGARPHAEVIAAHAENDLFVLASVVAPDGDRDGIPVVLMEAGHAGLALIATAVSGIPEIVRHMDTGWLVAPDDPLELANAIEALANDGESRRRLGQNARALVHSQFNIIETSRQVAAVFRGTESRARLSCAPEHRSLGPLGT